MHCMKCGKEIPEERVFCDGCLTVMDAYPVKPDTVVQIQKRPTRPERKHQKTVPLSETVRKQSAVIRWLVLAVAALVIAVGLLSGLLLNEIIKNSAQEAETPLGQNYTATDAQENVSRETSAPVETP